MNEEKQLKAYSNGEYVFAETENDNQFYFYRKDGRILGEVGRIPMDMYREYICMKIFESNKTEIVMNKIRFDMSDDHKCIRLTVFAIGEKTSIISQEEPKEGKRLVKSLFDRLKRKNR